MPAESCIAGRTICGSKNTQSVTACTSVVRQGRAGWWGWSKWESLTTRSGVTGRAAHHSQTTPVGGCVVLRSLRHGVPWPLHAETWHGPSTRQASLRCSTMPGPATRSLIRSLAWRASSALHPLASQNHRSRDHDFVQGQQKNRPPAQRLNPSS